MSSVTSQPPDLAARIAGDDFETEDLQELRLALVMTGGVSLAVWMGGVARELDRLVRGEQGPYLELLRFTRSLPRIDVIAGTSAGGLNGALLAYALTRGAPVGGLRDLWLELGALEDLLRDPAQANPPSLMRGDDYFLPQIGRAIGSLEGKLTEPDDVPLALIITTTLLEPWPRAFPDSFGTVIEDVDHHGEFAFRRGPGLSVDDDFAHEHVVARLALAARCTASFPFAFEASFVPIGPEHATPERPDMTDVADFQQSRFTVDGGVLLNRPLRPAVRAIFRRPAERQVRRVLAYVVPDPGEHMKVAPDDPAAAPSIVDVTAASLVSIPRNQSISADLDELKLHNDRVDAQRRRRELMVEKLDVDELARRLYPQYRRDRADLIVDILMGLLAKGRAALELQERAVEPSQREMTTDAPLRERAQLRDRLLERLENLPPDEFPRAGEEPADWFTTVETVERAAGVVLDLLRRGLAVLDPADPERREERAALRELRGRVFAHLTAAQAARAPLTRAGEVALARGAVLALREDLERGVTPATSLPNWLEQSLKDVLGDRDVLRPLVVGIANELLPAADAVLRACDGAPRHLRPRANAARDYAHALVRGLVGAPTPSAATTVSALYRLLALEVVQLALGDRPVLEQRVDLIQVSANAGNGLDPREHVDEKLAGLQAAHFGAFYKRSWRASDWMWGRHDAAQRLAQILLEPARLRQLGYGVEEVIAFVERIAFVDGLSPEDAATLRAAGPRRWDADEARAELTFLESANEPAPATIPVCAQAVARRLQLQVLREELPTVRRAIADDERDGAHTSKQARRFREEFDAAHQPLSAADAIALFAACTVGDERIAAEYGSDLFARTGSSTVAVTTSAVSGADAGLPKIVHRPLKAVRGLGLMIYLVVRYALEGHRFGSVVVSAAFLAGAVFVGVGLFVDLPGFLMTAGLGILLAAVALAIWRRRAWAVLLALAAGAVVALLPLLLSGWLTDTFEREDVDEYQPVFVVAGLLIAAYGLGRATVNWPRERRVAAQAPASADRPRTGRPARR